MEKLTFVAQLSLDFIFGEVNKIPSLGEEEPATTFDIQLGGGTLVYPIVLSRLGVDCHLIIKKAESVQSELALTMLNNCAIKELEVINIDDIDPVMSTAVISLKSDRSFVSYNNKAAFKFENDFLFERLKKSKVVFVLEQNIELIKRLKKNGCITVFDMGWSEDLDIQKYKDILQYVDFFTPNDKEAMKLTSKQTVKESLYVLKDYVKHPIISCGENGCITILNNEIIEIHVPDNIKAVDTTGAGDNFMAGLIYGIYQNMSIEDCMKFATCTGALSTTGYGCYGVKYTIDEVMDLFKCMK